MPHRTPATGLDRRAVLRGAAGGLAVAIPLPRLPAMLNGNGTAYAAGEPLRKVFGVWFWGNGIIPARWVPSATGAGFPLSEELMPFAKVKSHLTVLTGFETKFGTRTAHQIGTVAILTGTGGLSVPTIDQVVADSIGKETRLRSLEAGVMAPTEGRPHHQSVSHRGRGAMNPHELDPRKLFSRLFSALPATTPAPTNADPTRLLRLAEARRSVLDLVLEDARELQGAIGSEDRRRLDQHMEGLRTLEKRVQTLSQTDGPSTGCASPRAPVVGPDTRSEAPADVADTMAALVVTALACDLTRVFSFMFTPAAAHSYFRHLGLDEDFHDKLSHGEPGLQPKVNTGIVYMMSRFARFLEIMKETPDGAGNLLDNALVLGTSCNAWGRKHRVDDYPIVIGGKAGGALKGDYHHRGTRSPAMTDASATPPFSHDNASRALLTMVRIMGIDARSFGTGPGAATESVSEILR